MNNLERVLISIFVGFGGIFIILVTSAILNEKFNTWIPPFEAIFPSWFVFSVISWFNLATIANLWDKLGKWLMKESPLS